MSKCICSVWPHDMCPVHPDRVPPEGTEIPFRSDGSHGLPTEGVLVIKYMPDYETQSESCSQCGHPPHTEGECDAVVGYDHLNGDHECGCPGES
jgi:hypothetical protein